MNSRVYDVPTSAILFDGKRGNYFNIITSLKYKGCNEAILRIVPRINIDDIYSLIDSTEELSDVKKLT